MTIAATGDSQMRNKNGLTFADVLILLAIVLLLAALAVPRFIKVPDYGNEQDEAPAASTNTAMAAAATNSPATEP
jgi:Tfp pilus assembly protein FimT